jgi:hypothetical protein
MSPTNTSSEPDARTRDETLFLSVGLTCYLTSFFLPAITVAPSSLISGGSISGFHCALYALLLPVSGLPAFAAGAVNILALLSIVGRLSGWRERNRCVLAMAAIGLAPFSWLAIACLHASILIGHLVWIIGLLVLLVPEVVQYALGDDLDRA